MKTILIDAVHCFIINHEDKFIIFKEMFDLLEKYSNRKIILTGANDEQQKVFGLNNMPYDVFTLKHNPEKSNPEYYKIMLDNFHLKSDEVIYFEHDMGAVQSAKSIGINTYYYDNEKKDIESLKNFLDSNI